MQKNTGQTTIEYLIILAVIIVIALIVVGVLGGFPSFGTSINEQQSKLYWASASPLGISDWRFDAPNNNQLVIKNNSTEKITLVEIDIKEDEVTWIALFIENYNSEFDIYPGEQLVVLSGEMTCTGNTPYSYDVRLMYSVEGGLNQSIQVGQKSIVGQCI